MTLRLLLQRVLRPDSGTVTREQCHAPPHISNGDWISLVPHERLPEFSIVPREKPNTCTAARKKKQNKTRDSSPFMRWGPSFPAGPREQSRGLSQISIGGLTPFRPLYELQEIPVTTGDESRILCFLLRRGLTPRVNLECNTKIPVTIGEEHGFSVQKPR